MRFEIFRHFGYFVTESSRHMSEYVPYFRRTPELLEQFAPPTPPSAAARREERFASIRRQIEGTVDPLASSVLSLAQKRQMTDEILAAHAEWIRF